MRRQHNAGKPFFVWFNSTRMHLRTHVRESHRGRYQHGSSEYVDGMIEHDDTIGSLLKALDGMGIANDTIVVYTSDNGPHMNTWPDGAMTWFRSEKNTNWEGAFRVPCLVRWPGVIAAGTVTNELMSHNDWIPTLCSIAGEPEIVNKLSAGYTANSVNYKVHLDGYDQSQLLRGVGGSAANNNNVKSARNVFFYSDDDGLLVGMRKGDWKYVFSEQRKEGTMAVWAEPFTTLRLQKIFNLYQDPFERADITSNTYWDWLLNEVGGVYGIMDDVFQFVATFKEFPPRSFPPSFNPANILESTLDGIKQRQELRRSIDPERVRGTLNEMIKRRSNSAPADLEQYRRAQMVRGRSVYPHRHVRASGPVVGAVRFPSLLERRRGEEGDRRFHKNHDRPGESQIHSRRGAHRHLRSGRHAVG